MSDESCEGFEIAIEMRRHWAGEADASARLERHLEGCANCRQFERLGAESESRLRADAEEAKEKIDLERLRARGRRVLRGRWTDYGAFSLLVSIVFAVRGALKVTGVDHGDLDLYLAFAILFVVLPFVEMRRSRREIEDAWSSDTLFYSLRKDLDARLKGSVALAAFSTAGSILFFVDRVSGSGMFPEGMARAVFPACFGALGLFVLVVRVPRLLRARREIPVVPDPYAAFGVS